MSYDLSKYDYVEHEVNGVTEILAISTYAGKTVKGKAKCDPRDKANYSIEKGKALAAARCNSKVSAKRVNRATRKVAEAKDQLADAKAYLEKMQNYLADSQKDLEEADMNLLVLENQM